MNKVVYNEVRRIFDLKRSSKIKEANLKKENFLNEHKNIAKLEIDRNFIALKMAKSIVMSDEISKQVEQENLKIKLDEIDEKINKEYKKINVKEEEFEPKFDCKICSGYSRSCR